jgi:hypothetical protein
MLGATITSQANAEVRPAVPKLGNNTLPTGNMLGATITSQANWSCNLLCHNIHVV